MRLFGKDRDDVESEGDENRDLQTNSVRSKSVKAEKPRRKRKKEPKKPWGKKERYVILTLIVVTVSVSGVLALWARAWKLPNLPRLRLPEFTLPFFKEETIILEGNKADQTDTKVAKQVTQGFENATKSLSGVYGLYVVRLSDGYSYGVDETETFQAASLIKLPVMAGAFLKAEDDSLDLDGVYALKQTDKVGGAGSLQYKEPGFKLTYRELLRLMGKQSDNTAFNIIRKLLGDDYINGVATDVGMEKTTIESNQTTPKDVGLFFEKLYNGSLLTEKHKNELLDNLTDTDYEEWLAAGVPKSIKVSHKFGREVHVVNDAGIVFAERVDASDNVFEGKPYVVVILSKGVVEDEADEVFPILSEIVYRGEVGD